MQRTVEVQVEFDLMAGVLIRELWTEIPLCGPVPVPSRLGENCRLSLP